MLTRTVLGGPTMGQSSRSYTTSAVQATGGPVDGARRSGESGPRGGAMTSNGEGEALGFSWIEEEPTETPRGGKPWGTGRRVTGRST